MRNQNKERYTFTIYNCVAKRNDNTTIERVIKIQSWYSVEDLAIALVVMSSDPGLIYGVHISLDTFEDFFDYYDNPLLGEGFPLAELSGEEISIVVDYNDGVQISYLCKLIGTDVQEKRITRTTPICVSGKGYSRLTHDEYLKETQRRYEQDDLYKSIFPDGIVDSYFRQEESHIDWAIKDLTRWFNTTKENFMTW